MGLYKEVLSFAETGKKAEGAGLMGRGRKKDDQELGFKQAKFEVCFR